MEYRLSFSMRRTPFHRPSVRTLAATREYVLLPQDLRHRLAPRQLVDQLVQVADLPHGWLFDVLHSDTADHTLDQSPRRVQVRSVGVGLKFTDYPEVRAVGISPQLLDTMGFKDVKGKLGVPVTTVIPADFVGMGSGGAPVEASGWNVMTQSPDAL